MILKILSVNKTREVLDLGEGTPHPCSHLPNLLISTIQSVQLGLATSTLKSGDKKCWAELLGLGKQKAEMLL